MSCCGGRCVHTRLHLGWCTGRWLFSHTQCQLFVVSLRQPFIQLDTRSTCTYACILCIILYNLIILLLRTLAFILYRSKHDAPHSQVYDAASSGYTGRCTAPLLVDATTRRIVCNESSIIVRNLGTVVLPGWHDAQLVPEGTLGEIDALNDDIYNNVCCWWKRWCWVETSLCGACNDLGVDMCAMSIPMHCE